MGEVRKIEVDIMKVAAQMGLNSQRMLEYVFQKQPQQLEQSLIQEEDLFEPEDSTASVSLQEPIHIPVQEPINL
jgi:hypothetical protein